MRQAPFCKFSYTVGTFSSRHHGKRLCADSQRNFNFPTAVRQTRARQNKTRLRPIPPDKPHFTLKTCACTRFPPVKMIIYAKRKQKWRTVSFFLWPRCLFCTQARKKIAATKPLFLPKFTFFFWRWKEQASIAHTHSMKFTTLLCCSILIFFGLCSTLFAFTQFNLLLFLCAQKETVYRALFAIQGLAGLWLMFWLIAFRPTRSISWRFAWLSFEKVVGYSNGRFSANTSK